ncbi:MAG: ABC transporter permease [Candidatus Woesebacteria bacterium]
MIKKLLVPLTSYKFLLLQLTLREIKARYKQSFVGYAWVLLNPLAQLLVYSFVFSMIFRFPTNNVPYVVFLYSGLLPWTLFQTSIISATQSLVDNASLLKKIAFPREVIPYSVVFAKIVDFCFSGLLFIGLMLVLRVPVSLSIIAFLPIFIVQLLFTAGISLILSTCNLFFRDIQHLTNLLLMLWMYMTPIVYPLSLVPERYVWLYKLNPMVGIIEGYRSSIFGYPFEWSIILWASVVSIFTFVIGFLFFKKMEKHFADIA